MGTDFSCSSAPAEEAGNRSVEAQPPAVDPTMVHSVAVQNLPLLSVIIPIYNGEADLPELFRCLQIQTYPRERVEFWLVNNNSSDQTAAMVQAQSQRDPRFRYLHEAIQSAYAARNTGIRAANGSILVFTDADCRPQPDWLWQLVQPFADPKVGIVAGEVTALPGNTLLERFADRQDTLSQKHTLSHPFCAYGQTANLALRRSILEQTGLFRPYLTTGGDADLCWRILRGGDWQIHWAKQAIVQHRHRATLPELRRQWQRYGRSNRYLHQLHGVSLMPELTLFQGVYRCSRWLLKEIPLAVIQLFIKVFTKVNTFGTGVSEFVDAMVETPLTLICQQARAQGQRQARLPAAAKIIAWLTPPSAVVGSEAASSTAPEGKDRHRV